MPVHSGSILPSVLPMSPLFFCPRFILILSVSLAPLCSPSKGNAAMIPTNRVIWRRQKNKAVKKKDNWGNCWMFVKQPQHPLSGRCMHRKPPAAYLRGRKTRRINTWREIKKNGQGAFYKQRLTCLCDQNKTVTGLTLCLCTNYTLQSPGANYMYTLFNVTDFTCKSVP